MRLICTLQNPVEGKLFSDFLKAHDIENELDVTTEKDWGSEEYGNALCRIWVYDEDDVANAQNWYLQFEENPKAFFFQETINDKSKTVQEPLESLIKTKKNQRRPEQPLTQGIGIVTLYFLVTCTLLLLYGIATTPSISKIPSALPATPLLSPPINKKLMYDYPKAYEILDRVVRAYGIEKLQNPEELPAESHILLQQFSETPYWQGIYDKLVAHLQNKDTPWNFNAPLFEKIRQGEFWRIFSPALLHADILHLIFNMLWLLVIGKQMEQKMGAFPYLLFILLTGIFSNTAQYLMGGSNFIGFSGVLCAMIAFVWVRQRKAAWEDYQVTPSTFLFISLFIGLLFLVQLGSFFLESYNIVAFSPGMANTAHLSGAFIGWVLGHMNFFSQRY